FYSVFMICVPVSCLLVFFFSSRRRHTRSKRDWSSDVCSSDLVDEDESNANEIKVGELIVHQDAYIASKLGREIELTHREFELLHYLAKHIGQVMTREHLQIGRAHV